MLVILKRTLQGSLRLSAVIISLLAGLLGGLVLGRSSIEESVQPYMNYLAERLIEQHIVVFFLICGAMLMVIVSATGAGLISGEVHEGTFRLLVAKPNRRTSILLGKVLGMLIGTIILMVLSLSAMYAMQYAFGAYDGNVYGALLSYLPGYLLYGLIVTMFFSSLSVLLSCIAKKRIVALLPMLLIIVIVLVLPLVLRLVMSLRQAGSADTLSIVDLNYHFGSIFKWCVSFCGGIFGSSGQLEMPALLMNIFRQVKIDPDIARSLNAGVLTADNEYIPTAVILAVYLGLTVVNYIASFAIIRRKDV